MTPESRLREELCELADSMFSRGLTCGASGNISARLEDGGLLVTPTGTSMGRLDPARLSRLDSSGRLVQGDPPTKELPLHEAFYSTRHVTGAIVHLHSVHSVAVSMLPGTAPDNVLPSLTPYSVMRLGKVALLPYFRPGDPALGTAIRELAGKRAAILLANHGPVVTGPNLSAAVNSIEELEATAQLMLLTRRMGPRALSRDQVRDLVDTFDIEWDGA